VVTEEMCEEERHPPAATALGFVFVNVAKHPHTAGGSAFTEARLRRAPGGKFDRRVGFPG